MNEDRKVLKAVQKFSVGMAKRKDKENVSNVRHSRGLGAQQCDTVSLSDSFGVKITDWI